MNQPRGLWQGRSPPVAAVVPTQAAGARARLVASRLGEVLARIGPRIPVVVGDASDRNHDNIHQICDRFGATAVPLAATDEFAPGAARDIAAQTCNAKYLFFFDVDLLAGDAIIGRVLHEAEQSSRHPAAFTMIPCLYMTRKASHAVEQNKVDYASIWHDYLRGDFSGVINLAVASSALLVRRDHFLALGGHRPQFVGHGGEDLDLIFRLAQDWPIGRPGDDLFVDARQDSIAGSRGFRKYFAYYGLPAAFDGLLVAHRWHPRPPASRYFRAHGRNDALLQHFMRAAVMHGDAPPALPDLTVAEHTAIVAGPGIDDVQALRHFLPPLGRHQVVSTPEALHAQPFTQTFYIGMAPMPPEHWAHRLPASVRRIGTLTPQQRDATWRLTFTDRAGRIERDELHDGVRRVYGDGRSYKWVFHRGEDLRLGRVLYDFAPLRYDGLRELPPLDAYIRDLMRGAGYEPQAYPGLFMDQWAQVSRRARMTRKLNKLIRNPRAFFRDSKAARLLSGRRS